MNEAAERYKHYYETLSSETVGALRELAVPEIHFFDPFNDVVGVEHVVRVLAASLEDAEDLDLRVLDSAVGESGAWYFRWRSEFRPKRLRSAKRWVLEGVSEVRFNEQGLVVAHIDHWDSGRLFYNRLPVLGWVIRRVMKAMAVD